MNGIPTNPDSFSAEDALEIAKTYNLGKKCEVDALKRFIQLCDGKGFLEDKVKKAKTKLTEILA